MSNNRKINYVKNVALSLLSFSLFLTGCSKYGNNYYSSTSSDEKIPVEDYNRLTSPSGIYFNFSTGVLRWDSVEGAKAYVVVLNGEVLDDNVTKTSFTIDIDIFEEDKPYLFGVKALGSEDLKDSHFATYLYSKQQYASDYTFTYNDAGDGIAITGFASHVTADNKENITISSEIVDLPVTDIADNAFTEDDNIVNVVFPNTLRHIGKEAFKSCRSMQSIILNEGLESIADYAFYNLKLTTIIIPSTVTSLGEYSFANNSSVTSLVFGDVTFSSEGSYTVNKKSKLTTIAPYAFSGLSNLTELNLPSSVEELQDSCFASLSKLNSINFNFDGNSNLKKIGPSAFTSINLNEFTLPSSVELIDEYAFSSSKISNFYVSENSVLETLGAGAFSNCQNLVYFGPETTQQYTSENSAFISPKSLKTIGDSAFINIKFKSFDIQTGSVLETIEASAFSNSSISQINFPATLTSIGARAFEKASIETAPNIPSDNNINNVDSEAFLSTPWFNNSERIIFANTLLVDRREGITDLVIEEGVKYIANSVYNVSPSKSTITSISLPNSLIRIHNYAFADLKGISEISFPANLEYIGDYAFQTCSNLRTINYSANSKLTHIGNYAFANIDTNLQIDSQVPAITTISIPSSVEYIGTKAFATNVNVKTINFNNTKSLKYIGEGAFSELYSLTSFFVPASVETIGADMLKPHNSGSQVTDITFENNSKLQTIGIGAFAGHYLVQSIDLPDSVVSIGDSAFSSMENLTQFNISNNSKLEILGSNVFSKTKITSIYLPNSIKEVASAAFKDLSTLTSVTFGSDAFVNSETKTIYTSTFENCTNLTSIIIPKNIQNIEANAFLNCLSLIDIETSASTINKDAFANTAWENSFEDGLVILNNILLKYSLDEENIVIDANITSINEGAFANKNLKSITLPSSLKTIGANAFDNCKNLETVIFASGSVLTEIGANSFANCSKLNSINFGTMLNKIGEGAFKNCYSLESIDLSNTLIEDLSDYCFQACINLKNIKLPKSLVRIGKYAFNYTQLNEVSIPNNVEIIDDYAFSNIGVVSNSSVEMSNWIISEYTLSNVRISATSSINHIGKYAFENAVFEKISLPSDNDLFIDDYAFKNCSLLEFNVSNNMTVGNYILNGCSKIEKLSHNSKYLTITFFGVTIDDVPSGLKYLIINNGSTTISNYAFIGFNNLVEITLPETITTIGDYAFYGCNKLTNINIGNVESVGNYAFYGCTNLTSIEISNNLTNIGNAAFYGTDWLENQTDEFVVVNGILIAYNGTNNIVTLPDNVTTIAGGSFLSTPNITEIIASENLVKINHGAFDNATGLLKLVLNSNAVVQIDTNLFDMLSDDFKVYVNNIDEYKNDIYWFLYSEYLNNL